jgi:hypothetical protein
VFFGLNETCTAYSQCCFYLRDVMVMVRTGSVDGYSEVLFGLGHVVGCQSGFACFNGPTFPV